MGACPYAVIAMNNAAAMMQMHTIDAISVTVNLSRAPFLKKLTDRPIIHCRKNAEISDSDCNIPSITQSV